MTSAPMIAVGPTNPPHVLPSIPATRIVGRARRCGSIRAWADPVLRAIAATLAIGMAAVSSGASAVPPGALEAPHFVEETGAIDHRYAGDFQYFVGGGVAAFDCDDDGRSELFLAGGSEPAALYHNESEHWAVRCGSRRWRRRSPT